VYMKQVIDYTKYLRKKQKNPNGFIDPSKSRTYMIFGNKGSGKSSTDELIAQKNYEEGHTIMDIHSASNYESLFWAICHDCKKQWDEWREKNNKKPVQEREEEQTHCNCSTRYPILLVVPDYVEIDQSALDIFNEKFISKEKWIEKGGNPEQFRIQKRHEDGHIYTEPRIDPDYREWIKVRKLHVPNKGFKNREIFVEELTHAMLTAQKERRIFVINTKFYKTVDHKLVTLEKMIREIPEIVSSHFKPLTPEEVGEMRNIHRPVPFDQMTPQESNYHRVTILMREFGSLVAQQLNEERNQVIVKKAIFGIIKIIRQFRMSGIFDAQRYGDVYAGVRDQRDCLIFRRSNIDIFPKDYEWFRNELKETKEQKINEIGFEYANILYPNIEDLKDNQMYVLYPEKTPSGKRYNLFNVGMPDFHHRQEDDDFEQLTGIKKENALAKGTWRFISKDGEGKLLDSQRDIQNEDRKLQEVKLQQVYETAYRLMHPIGTAKKMKADEVYEHLKTVDLIPEGWKGTNNLRVFMTRMKGRIQKFGQQQTT